MDENVWLLSCICIVRCMFMLLEPAFPFLFVLSREKGKVYILVIKLNNIARERYLNFEYHRTSSYWNPWKYIFCAYALQLFFPWLYQALKRLAGEVMEVCSMSEGGGLESEPASPVTLRLRPTHLKPCCPDPFQLSSTQMLGILLWNRPGVFFLTQEICILLFPVSRRGTVRGWF